VSVFLSKMFDVGDLPVLTFGNWVLKAEWLSGLWNYMYVFNVFLRFFQNQKTWLFTFFWVVAHVFPNSASMCVGEWSGRQRTSTQIIHWCPHASSLVCGWWWQRVGRGLLQSSRSAAWHSTTATTRHWLQQLSTRAVGANTTMLQSRHVTAVCCSQQQPSVVDWHDLAVPSALSEWLITASLWLILSICLWYITTSLFSQLYSNSTRNYINDIKNKMQKSRP